MSTSSSSSESGEQKISLGSVLDRVMVSPAEAHVFLSSLAQSIGHAEVTTAMRDVADDIAYGRQSGGTQPESTRQPGAPDTDETDTPEGSQASTGLGGHGAASGPAGGSHATPPSTPPTSGSRPSSRGKDDD